MSMDDARMTREEAIKFLEETSIGAIMFDDKNMVAVCDLAISALREQEKRRWIPVAERLPEEDGSYLVTTNYFGKRKVINICGFAKDGETVDEYDLTGKKYVWYFYDNEYGFFSTDSVTHWMPLPKPPKEDV